MRLATRLGISVPKELSIVGFDDISLARQIFPALTTIRQPLGAMAREATLALIEGSRGRPREAGLDVIPATIQIRESTGPAPSAN